MYHKFSLGAFTLPIPLSCKKLRPEKGDKRRIRSDTALKTEKMFFCFKQNWWSRCANNEFVKKSSFTKD